MELTGRTGLIVVATLLLNFCSALAATESTGTDAATLNTLEKKLFMQTFSSENVSHRLARLERRVFGKTTGGSTEERLAHLQQATGGSDDAVFAAPPANDFRYAPPTNTAPNTIPSQSAFQSAPPHTMSSQSANAAAREQEQLRVQAAEEQQITSLLSEGVSAWKQHNAELALDRFKQVVRLDPQNVQAYFSVGIIYETQGDFQKALENYQTAGRLRPNNRNYSEAVTQVQKKLAARKQTESKHLELTLLSSQALDAYNRGQYLEALDLYKQVDDKFPDQAINKYNIGSVYLVMHQPEVALPYYKKARELDPRNQKFSQAYDSLQHALKEQQAKASERSYPTAAGAYPKSTAGYPAPAGPSKHVRRSKENNVRQSETRASGFIVNYGLEVKGSSKGIKVKSVLPGTRAATTGIQSGDIIKAVNGTVVNTTRDIDQILSSCNPMRQLQLTIQRDKRMMQMAL